MASKAGNPKAFNNKVLAANNSALKTVHCVDINIHVKPKPEEFAHDLLIMVDNCLPCLLGLDFVVDQICIPNTGEQLLYSTKLRTALPLLAITKTAFRIFAVA